MEIHDTLLVGKYKDPNFKKFNNKIDTITHIYGFEYNMEFKCGVNEYLKAKYFPMSLIGEARKWFHSLEPCSITYYQQLKDQFKAHFKCNMKKLVDLTNLIHCKQGKT